MTRLQHAIAVALGLVCLLLVAASGYLVLDNRQAQRELASRQQFLQQSVQLEGLYRDIVRALAELAARHNDADVRTMLARHGITYTVNAPPAPAEPAPAPRR